LNSNLHKDNWIPLSEASGYGPYSSEYLRLLVRHRKILARKIDDIRYTTPEALGEYVRMRAEVKALGRKKDADVIMSEKAPIENWGYLLNFKNKDNESEVKSETIDLPPPHSLDRASHT